VKQILQNLGSGQTELVDVPAPAARAGSALIRTRASVVSIGTERMLVDFGQAGLLQKARQQPEKVKQVLEKIGTDGLLPTIDAVRAKLDQPIALGYCNVGQVIECDPAFAEGGIAAGDRVVSNGPHAEVVCVPKNLCARVPENVSDETAAFTVLGAIALQGVRLLQPTLGECVAVTGLGAIGLLAVQILQAHGCRVLAIDFDSGRCEIARRFGAEPVDLSTGAHPVEAGLSFSGGKGIDCVLITASTRSNDPMHQAALLCRQRGRIVLVGVVGLELSRADFYEKELTFQVSCSYGPGRYDSDYEDKGRDYPIGFVRWTEQRNFEAVLGLMATGKIEVGPLITHRFPFPDALKAYEALRDSAALGILLEYEQGHVPGEAITRDIALRPAEKKTSRPSSARPVIGFIGAGGFAAQVLLPALKTTGARLKIIVSARGVTGTHLGKKFGFETSATETESVFADPEINGVIISTRHDSHARYVIKALQSGKSVFVEKPLCLNSEELEAIIAAHGEASQPFLMVGFNRRFAPQIEKMKQLLEALREPKTMIMTVNAGMLPADHWIHDPAVGGGRIIAEGCHFIDLLRFLAGSPIATIQALPLGKSGEPSQDSTTINLKFDDGSMGTVHYLANGHKSFPKERLEVFCAGRILQLDNFRRLTGFGWKGFAKLNLWRQDKGHAAEMKAFVYALEHGADSPISLAEIVEVTRATFQVAQSRAGNRHPSSV
jgi:predicted dehydrogenase/threonine dehydrogenase-like Zn-dependent dehydrogenase